MSKIEDGGGASGPGSVSSSVKVKEHTNDSASSSKEKRPDSAEAAAERMSGVTLDSSPFGEKTRPDPGKGKQAGPSLLSQQAPGAAAQSQPSVQPPPYSSTSDDPMGASETPLSTSAMSVDGLGAVYDGPEKITVKIADLGNGECPNSQVACVRITTSA